MIQSPCRCLQGRCPGRGLPGQTQVPSSTEFQINDEKLLVYVGPNFAWVGPTYPKTGICHSSEIQLDWVLRDFILLNLASRPQQPGEAPWAP